MRNSKLNLVVSSDVDLTALSNARIQIVRDERGAFEVTSTLKFYTCEKSQFFGRFLRRKLPGLKFITGNCSAPSGYYWS
ncbi:hypothetical protein [Polaromonas sp.]|uniref:hypothetical protein n=1 Tax=Polaromonas sp. TaxID=1869339 RepID=UPI003BB5EE15